MRVVNRILSWIEQYDIAYIPTRNRELKAYLLSLGYGVTSFQDNHIEIYGTTNSIAFGENCFLVMNLNDDTNFKYRVFTISEYFDQDCFMFKPKGNIDAFNIGTSKSGYPGYGTEDNIGKLHIKVDDVFLSRIGNSSLKEALNIDVYEDYSRGSRMSIKSIYHRITNGINKNMITKK